jgi:amidophosphoribosyltransferase
VGRTWRDACGVFGIWGPGEDVARIAFFGLYALQHRGQESAGIAVSDGTSVRLHTGLGLASQIFDEGIITSLTGTCAIGHVRYSTTGGNVLCNAQPFYGEHRSGPFAVGHNGNLVNTVELRTELERLGETFVATSDTEVIARLISRSSAPTLEEAVAEAMQRMEGAYSLTILGPDRILAVRDPYGVRPLCIGRMGGGPWIVASETCALSTVGAEFVREVLPGEIVTLGANGQDSLQAMEPERRACCIFEFIYFARPDSHIYGRNVYMARLRMGHMLAQQAPVEADLVVGVPESAIPHAMGYAQVSHVPFGEGFIKNRYIHRTFIMPDQRMREAGVRMKLTPLREAVAGKRLVVVDDSIVRGTTTGPEIELLREAGAREIHLRISCPPIRFPCYYGIDTATRKELIASRMSVDEVRRHVGADTLTYLDMKNLVKAVGLPKANFCTACFDEMYPIPIARDVKISKYDLENGNHAEPAEGGA